MGEQIKSSLLFLLQYSFSCNPTFYHYVKSVGIRSFSGLYFAVFGLNTPYSVQMRENTDQKNSEYGHFSRSVFQHGKKAMETFIFLCTFLLQQETF